MGPAGPGTADPLVTNPLRGQCQHRPAITLRLRTTYDRRLGEDRHEKGALRRRIRALPSMEEFKIGNQLSR